MPAGLWRPHTGPRFVIYGNCSPRVARSPWYISPGANGCPGSPSHPRNHPHFTSSVPQCCPVSSDHSFPTAHTAPVPCTSLCYLARALPTPAHPTVAQPTCPLRHTLQDSVLSAPRRSLLSSGATTHVSHGSTLPNGLLVRPLHTCQATVVLSPLPSLCHPLSLTETLGTTIQPSPRACSAGPPAWQNGWRPVCPALCTP